MNTKRKVIYRALNTALGTSTYELLFKENLTNEKKKKKKQWVNYTACLLRSVLNTDIKVLTDENVKFLEMKCSCFLRQLRVRGISRTQGVRIRTYPHDLQGPGPLKDQLSQGKKIYGCYTLV